MRLAKCEDGRFVDAVARRYIGDPGAGLEQRLVKSISRLSI